MAGEFAEVVEIFEAAEVAVEIHLLRDVGEAALGFQGFAGDVEAVDERAAGVGGEETEKAVDRGGLAGAVGAEEGEELAGCDGEV